MRRTPCYLPLPLLCLALGIGSLAAQRPRDLSTPATRLVGHWLNLSDSTHLYFGPTDPTTHTGTVRQRAAGSGGRVVRFRYTIGPQAPVGEQIAVEIVSSDGAHWCERYHRFRVAPDGQAMTRSFLCGDIMVQQIFRYLDARTVP